MRDDAINWKAVTYLTAFAALIAVVLFIITGDVFQRKEANSPDNDAFLQGQISERLFSEIEVKQCEIRTVIRKDISCQGPGDLVDKFSHTTRLIDLREVADIRAPLSQKVGDFTFFLSDEHKFLNEQAEAVMEEETTRRLEIHRANLTPWPEAWASARAHAQAAARDFMVENGSRSFITFHGCTGLEKYSRYSVDSPTVYFKADNQRKVKRILDAKLDACRVE